MSKKLSGEIEMFSGGNLEGIIEVSSHASWTLVDGWILVFLFGIVGGPIDAIAVGIPIAPESGRGTRLRKVDLLVEAWLMAGL